MSQKHSEFWLDSDFAERVKEGDVLSLAMHRRAISNFVSILTGKNIPVRYRVEGHSYTTGDVVQISADVASGKFDETVGVALHEASHIVYTDFGMLKNLFNTIPMDLFDKGERLNIDKQTVCGIVKDIWNYVEDRFIDMTVYKSAPGYRGYYKAMYSEYWESPDISKVLKSNEYRSETLNSYMYRIINLTNKDTDLRALKGLIPIVKTIGFSDILRLKYPIHRLKVAFDVVDIIFDNVLPAEAKKKYFSIYQPREEHQTSSVKPVEDDSWPSKFDDGTGDQNSGKSEGDGSEKGDSETESGDSGDKSDSDEFGNDFDIFGGLVEELEKDGGSDSSDIGEGDDSKPSGVQNEGKTKSVPKSVMNRAEELFEKQKKFMNGEHDFVSISSEMNDVLQAVEEAKTEVVSVGDDGDIKVGKVDCIVVNRMTKAFLSSGICGLCNGTTSLNVNGYSKSGVDKGLRLGRLLGKKLKVRGESRSTLFSRKKNGKIDPRLINELGFDNESVFSRLEIDSYKKAFLHISVDASGSMQGTKFENTITCVVAIARAASMIQNLDVVISFRTQSNLGLPMVVIGYDSREDKIQKIKSLFPYLQVNSFTPEGLCFQAMLEKIPASSAEVDSYFLNFSDGEPAFSFRGIRYIGAPAVRHTRKQVKKITDKGVHVLSYFIEGGLTNLIEDFRSMYGRDAKFVDVTNVAAVASTMNDKFLKK